MEEENEKIMYKIQYHINVEQNVSLCVDNWTSTDMNHFFGITTNFYDNNERLNNSLIKVKELDRVKHKKKSSQLIKEILMDTFDKYEIHQQAVPVTSDFGGDIVKTINEDRNLNLVHIPCICHIINNSLKEFWKSDTRVKYIFDCFREFSNHFRSSFISQDMLDEYNEQKNF